MVDVHSQSQRSANMAAIKGRNTRPEMAVRSFIHRQGFRFSLHRKDLPGKPDIVLPKYQTAIFVHGCYWHRHAGCKLASTPKSNVEFWKKKFEDNVVRDERASYAIGKKGWNVITVWECEVRSREYEAWIAERILKNNKNI